jgi:hypothetical protein
MTAENQDPGRRPQQGGARSIPVRQISEADYLHPTPERQAELSAEIDRYFNTPLDMFPFSETTSKPDRFYKFYEESIAERFPDDEDIRSQVSRYTRRFYRALAGYVFAKRFFLLLAFAGIWLITLEGPAVARSMGLDGVVAAGVTALAMVLIYPLFAGINALVFLQYRISLENRSYELSRQIIQRTRELQNLYTTVRALPDQEETRYQNEGEAWGKRSAYLIRLVMWVAKRMEYLEKFVQVEMWRVRRERYWINWFGGALVLLLTAAWIAAFVLIPSSVTAVGGDGYFRVVQGSGILLGLVLAWASYHFWKTPLNIARDKLGAESWIRYATLDLDDTIGDQVARDKTRLVEYRTLNKGH